MLDLRELIHRQARFLQPAWQEDCLQEVLIQILRRVRRGDALQNPVGFAVTFVRRRLVDELRRRGVVVWSSPVIHQGAETEVVVVGPGLVPVVVDVRGATPSVWLIARDATKLPGIPTAVELHRPLDAAFAPGRIVHRYAPRRSEIDRTMGRLADLPTASTWLWPCDYDVAVDGAHARANWAKGTWTLVR